MTMIPNYRGRKVIIKASGEPGSIKEVEMSKGSNGVLIVTYIIKTDLTELPCRPDEVTIETQIVN